MRLAPILAALAVAACSPALDRPSAGVLAVRDRVPDVQRWGTEAYTRSMLERSYGWVVYLDDPERPGALSAALGHLLDECETVDLFLLAHENAYVNELGGAGSRGPGGLRLVYNTGPSDADQAPQWLALGARAYVGHRGGANVAPLAYVEFLPRWLAGAPVGEAARAVNADAHAWLREGASGWALERVLDRNLDELADATQLRVFGDERLSIADGPHR